MKLLRYGPPGHEKPGMLDSSGDIRDLSGVIPDLSGEALQPESIERLRVLESSGLRRVEKGVRIGPCVGGVGKFICIGLNYSDHAAESGMAVPAEPILFMKATSAICGPDDGIVIPRGSQKTDWEVELGVVIGKTARYVDENKDKRILVHCQANFRATAFVALYRILRHGWNTEDAMEGMHKIWDTEDYPIWKMFIEENLKRSREKS